MDRDSFDFYLSYTFGTIKNMMKFKVLFKKYCKIILNQCF